jgi:predicted transcriptional regulator
VQRCPTLPVYFALVIDAETAREIEARFAESIGMPADDVRDYLNGNVRAGAGRRTGYRFIRGTHGGTYVVDPDGVDLPPYPVPAAS